MIPSHYMNKALRYSIAIVLVLTTFNLTGQVLKYHEISGDETCDYHYTINETPDGYRIDVARTSGKDTTDVHVLITYKKDHTKSWSDTRFGENTNVLARLTSKGVHIKGFLDGDELDEMEELDDDEPWIQIFPLNPGFESFIFSNEDEIVFWSIGTESPADMEIASFSAEKEETEFKEEFGCEVMRVNFGPTGWKSLFWDGDYFFRPHDGRIMGYRGDGAPGKPSAKTTLILEN